MCERFWRKSMIGYVYASFERTFQKLQSIMGRNLQSQFKLLAFSIRNKIDIISEIVTDQTSGYSESPTK